MSVKLEEEKDAIRRKALCYLEAEESDACASLQQEAKSARGSRKDAIPTYLITFCVH